MDFPTTGFVLTLAQRLIWSHVTCLWGCWTGKWWMTLMEEVLISFTKNNNTTVWKYTSKSHVLKEAMIDVVNKRKVSNSLCRGLVEIISMTIWREDGFTATVCSGRGCCHRGGLQVPGRHRGCVQEWDEQTLLPEEADSTSSIKKAGSAIGCRPDSFEVVVGRKVLTNCYPSLTITSTVSTT